MRIKALFVTTLLASSSMVFAQSPSPPQQQQITASEAAIAIDSMVNNLAQSMERNGKELDYARQQIISQQKEIADLHAQLDALKKAGATPPAAASGK